MMDYRRQDNNYPKAFLATAIIMALLIGLSYFIVFQHPAKEEDGTGGILVNYGTVDEGMGDDYMSTEEPSVAENANQSKPDKVTPTPPTEEVTPTENSSKAVVTQTNEDAPEISNDKKPSQTVATQQKPTKEPPKEVINQNALYKGKTNNGTGEGDGTGNKPGNQGKPTGSTLTNDYTGTGSGNGGNLNMTQRSFISKPSVSDNSGRVGKVVVDIKVDKQGNVISARAGGRGTNLFDSSIFSKCEAAVKNVRLNASESAPDTQEGTVIFVFKVQ
ncbi:energy transducer TonB [Mucilaginibacter terrae]|uniref:energy transducer TonB family protein n=1 Tax=Mucilaginibacter terrae TaxID=1955052 RepID=UPI0036443F66